MLVVLFCCCGAAAAAAAGLFVFCRRCCYSNTCVDRLLDAFIYAARHLERASELDSSYPGTCLDLGQLLMQEGSPAEALST